MALSRLSTLLMRHIHVHQTALKAGALRAFHSTPRVLGSPLLNLSGLSTSRESQFLSKERGIPRTEFSPHLELIRSSEVKPFATGGTTANHVQNPSKKTKISPAAHNPPSPAALGVHGDGSNARDGDYIVAYLLQDNKDLKARILSLEAGRKDHWTQQADTDARYKTLDTKLRAAEKDARTSAICLIVLFGVSVFSSVWLRGRLKSERNKNKITPRTAQEAGAATAGSYLQQLVDYMHETERRLYEEQEAHHEDLAEVAAQRDGARQELETVRRIKDLYTERSQRFIGYPEDEAESEKSPASGWSRCFWTSSD